MLRLLTECLILVGSAMFGATFLSGHTCWITIILEHRKNVVYNIIDCHQIIVSATEKSYKMASTLCQNGLKELVFSSNSSNFVHFGPHDLVQISQACNTNAYQKMYEETLDFQC